MTSRTPIAKTDDLDILSAIWILSCNDENPIITYKGISFRLDLPEAVDVKKLVRSRSELFRPGVLESRLKAWKDRMKSGRNRPSWITEIGDEAAQLKTIETITKDYVFRNQFRVEDGAPKCSIEIIDWGLNHIDRLRKSDAEEREASAKKWATIIIPSLSIILALLSVFTTAGLQWTSIREQGAMKRYEVSFKPKKDAYSKFMLAITNAAVSAAAQEKANVLIQASQAEEAYYLFEPFLNENTRKDVLKELAEFTSLCFQRTKLNLPEDSAENLEYSQKVGVYKARFQALLYESLFGNNAIQ